MSVIEKHPPLDLFSVYLFLLMCFLVILYIFILGFTCASGGNVFIALIIFFAVFFSSTSYVCVRERRRVSYAVLQSPIFFKKYAIIIIAIGIIICFLTPLINFVSPETYIETFSGTGFISGMSGSNYPFFLYLGIAVGLPLISVGSIIFGWAIVKTNQDSE